SVFWTLFGALIALLGLGAAAASILWPGTLLTILYGCEPGLAVLVVVLAAQWMVHQRYRRQVVFLPGFTRLKAGSSLVRTGSSQRPREPSTIDAAPSVGGGPNSGVSGTGAAKGN